jgi:hypothetical protein
VVPRLQNPAPLAFICFAHLKRQQRFGFAMQGGQRADKKATVPSILSKIKVLDLNNKNIKNLIIGIVIKIFTLNKNK